METLEKDSRMHHSILSLEESTYSFVNGNIARKFVYKRGDGCDLILEFWLVEIFK